MILITGGMKSGKSTFALNMALKYTKRAFLATGVPFDEEMRLRIEKHKAERKELFDTFEEPVNVTEVLKNIDNNYDVILFECLTTYLGNLYYYQLDVQERIDGLVDVLSNMSSDVIVVTNEVGWGIIPENPIARQYAEILGKTNTRLAKLAKEVYLVVSGIGVRIK
ncbi:MAG: bifunctional adenosylcobinamide kinase/adenosylcobinamide-phosphate guanylyltransferase [Fervidobacterium sp.]|uniref:bifunctional adenosylcobinamide kinase/adenosylcobinamide-phosphate guanylyltransferase n=1 Tax=Fervidobacterium sp. TaxID=1871331 RepID=UPI0025BAAF56|nr:bifunctional adenosylcobinamide kinase/adenosylcobinamide-phosphate guanylyltransferase [Fervidobacterium sp.]NPU90046.1 bifunctional adenosylcobinamide kinase/adenosylcobinamide-phosphate guanylyltransferase [Fervidobacterium sp.]